MPSDENWEAEEEEFGWGDFVLKTYLKLTKEISNDGTRLYVYIFTDDIFAILDRVGGGSYIINKSGQNSMSVLDNANTIMESMHFIKDNKNEKV